MNEYYTKHYEYLTILQWEQIVNYILTSPGFNESIILSANLVARLK